MTSLETILTNTYTKLDLHHRLDLLKGFLEYQFFTNKSGHQNLIYLLNDYFVQKKESRDEFNALVAWGNPFYEFFNKDNFYDLIKNMEQAAKRLPVTVLYLPFVPPIYEIPQLGSWFRKNIDEKMILDLKLDPKLIGGCALAWKGIYRDFSLRFYIEKNKETIEKAIADLPLEKKKQSL